MPDTTVDLLRRAFADPGQWCNRKRWPDTSGIPGWEYEMVTAWGARAAEMALIAAGRLVPASDEGRVEWGWRVDVVHPKRPAREVVGYIKTCPEPNARRAPRVWHGWTTVRRTYRPRVNSPWVEVPADEKPASAA